MSANNIKCRYCSSTTIKSIGGLGEMPPCGFFPDDPDQKRPNVDLSLFQCIKCDLVQLMPTDIALSDQYGENYGYRSGLNPMMIKHLKTNAAQLLANENFDATSIILEIAANDGTHVREFSKTGAKLIAVDPAIKNWTEYYDFECLKIDKFFPCPELNEYLGKMDCIISHACFYDLPDVKEFITGVSSLLKNGGKWCFEQIYLPAMIYNTAFDSICDEHLEYYHLSFLEKVLREHDLFIDKVEINDVNGGSIRVTAQKGGFDQSGTGIKTLVKLEQNFFGHTNRNFEIQIKDFWNRVDEFKIKIHKILNEVSHLNIYACGASTKGNVILKTWELHDKIKAILEINPKKFGKYTPFGSVPILNEDELNIEGSVVIILPWHFGNSIVQSYLKRGVNVLIPLPEPKLIMSKKFLEN